MAEKCRNYQWHEGTALAVSRMFLPAVGTTEAESTSSAALNRGADKYSRWRYPWHPRKTANI
jgi:predicted PhzF superfamily epimerase YddE/YHI9